MNNIICRFCKEKDCGCYDQIKLMKVFEAMKNENAESSDAHKFYEGERHEKILQEIEDLSDFDGLYIVYTFHDMQDQRMAKMFGIPTYSAERFIARCRKKGIKDNTMVVV